MARTRVTQIAQRVVNAGLALVFLSGPAAAECVTAEQWLREVVGRSSGVKIDVSDDVSGQEALDDVARMNAVPPTTHLVADRIMVLTATHLQSGLPMAYALVAFFYQGCKVASGRADRQEVKGLLHPGEGI